MAQALREILVKFEENYKHIVDELLPVFYFDGKLKANDATGLSWTWLKRDSANLETIRNKFYRDIEGLIADIEDEYDELELSPREFARLTEEERESRIAAFAAWLDRQDFRLAFLATALATVGFALGYKSEALRLGKAQRVLWIGILDDATCASCRPLIIKREFTLAELAGLYPGSMQLICDGNCRCFLEIVK